VECPQKKKSKERDYTTYNVNIATVKNEIIDKSNVIVKGSDVKWSPAPQIFDCETSKD
jgi:hypothetical protein